MGKRKLFTDDESKRFGDDLRKKIKQKGLTVTEAAKILGVSRQALYSHFDAKHQPRRRLVERAVRVLDMVVYAQSQKFDKQAFGPDAPRKESAIQLLLLPEALERLKSSNLEAKVVKTEGNSIYLELLVKFVG